MVFSYIVFELSFCFFKAVSLSLSETLTLTFTNTDLYFFLVQKTQSHKTYLQVTVVLGVLEGP